MSMVWQALAWEALTREDVYDLLALRARVFVLEQGPYLDPDGVDDRCHHLLGRLAAPSYGLPAGELVAYLRVVAPRVKYAEPSIGRVVNRAELRGQGVGRELVARGVALADALYPGQGQHISAQAHLARFYGDYGFQPLGEPYLEDGIPHLAMRRRAGQTA